MELFFKKANKIKKVDEKITREKEKMQKAIKELQEKKRKEDFEKMQKGELEYIEVTKKKNTSSFFRSHYSGKLFLKKYAVEHDTTYSSLIREAVNEKYGAIMKKNGVKL